jgi:hypothetical protein
MSIGFPLPTNVYYCCYLYILLAAIARKTVIKDRAKDKNMF